MVPPLAAVSSRVIPGDATMAWRPVQVTDSAASSCTRNYIIRPYGGRGRYATVWPTRELGYAESIHQRMLTALARAPSSDSFAHAMHDELLTLMQSRHRLSRRLRRSIFPMRRSETARVTVSARSLTEVGSSGSRRCLDRYSPRAAWCMARQTLVVVERQGLAAIVVWSSRATVAAGGAHGCGRRG